MNRDFLPRKEADFYAWAVTFFSCLMLNLERFGIAESVITPLLALVRPSGSSSGAKTVAKPYGSACGGKTPGAKKARGVKLYRLSCRELNRLNPARRRLCLRRAKSKRSRLQRSKVDVNERIYIDKVSHCGMFGDMLLTRRRLLPSPTGENSICKCISKI